MKYMFKIVMVLLVALVATGCSTRNVKRDFSFDETKSSGLLFMSVTQPIHSTTNMAITKLQYDGVKKGSIASQKEGMFGGVSFKALLQHPDKRDFKGMKGRVVAVELPAGDYDFYNWGVSRNNVHITPVSEPPRVGFSIKSGEITYAGNYNIEPIDGENIFGIPLLAGIYPVVSNKIDRDIKALYKKFPALKQYSINSNVEFEGLWVAESQGFDRDVSPVYVPPPVN